MEYLGPAILILRRRQVDGQRRGVARPDQQRRGRHEEADGRLRRIDDGLAEAQTEAQLAASAASADLQRLTQPQFRLLAGGQTRLQIIFSFQSRVQTELECRPTSFSRKTKSKKNSIHRAFHGKCTGHDCDRNQPVQVSILSDLHYLYRFHSPVLSPHLNGHLEKKNEITCLVRFLPTPKSIFHRTGRL